MKILSFPRHKSDNNAQKNFLSTSYLQYSCLYIFLTSRWQLVKFVSFTPWFFHQWSRNGPLEPPMTPYDPLWSPYDPLWPTMSHYYGPLGQL